MSWLLVLPSIDPAQFAGFMETCALPHDRILVVENADNVAPGWDGRIFRPGRNLGVAGSWNVGRRAVLDERLDWMIIASTSLRFGLSGGFDFVAALDAHDGWVAETEFGWHLTALDRFTLARVGPFDEQFWPGYYEDNDYIWRMQLLGLQLPTFTDLSTRLPCQGEFGVQAATLLAGLAPVNLYTCSQLYEAKWGGQPGSEKFTVPFGDQGTAAAE